MNKENLKEMIDKGYINKIEHPSGKLFIYNYSKSCQFDYVWNEETMTCRGLIVDKDDNVISRPFKKFFNYEEREVELPNLPFRIYEKLDGSLGILYWLDDLPFIATRGSFTSEQAIHATEILRKKYSDSLDKLDKSKTYLFEIIYPEDPHVVRYYDTDDIFLLAIIDTKTGEELDIKQDIFKTPKLYDGIKDFKEIRNMIPGDNKEGFVVKFDNNFRIKLKYESYLKLFSAKNNLNEKTILEAITTETLEEYKASIDILDEEAKIYFQNTVEKFKNMYKEKESYIKSVYKDFETDKEAAEYFTTFPFSGILFCMRKGKDYSKGLWKIIKNELKPS